MRKIFTFVLALMMLLVPQAVRCQEELTIYENGTATNTSVPVQGTWTDAFLKCEFVIPADQLGEMDGGIISQMTFYPSTLAGAAWTGTFQVFLMEVNNTTISAYYGPDNATVVYEGSLDASQSTMNVEFNNTYTYGGGNLLIGVYQIVKGNFKSAAFAGENVSGASVQGYSSSSLGAVTVNQRNFIPKTTFLYTPGGGPVCEKPTGITMNNITLNSATVSWTGEGSAYNLQYKASTATDWTEVNGLTDLSYNLTGLVPNTTYSVRVQQVCTESTSGWKTTSFATPVGLPLVETFDLQSVTPAGWTHYRGLLDNVLNGTDLEPYTGYGSWSFSSANGVFDNHAYVDVYGENRYIWLISPAVRMENGVYLSFDMALTRSYGTLNTPETNGTDDKFVVLITADGGSTWEILRQWDNAGSEYVYNNISCSVDGENVSIDLSSYADQNIAIAFYGESTASNADNNLHIDNVRIDYGIPCKRPTGLTVTDVAPYSATLSWNENGSATTWQLCLNDDTTNLVTADTNPFTLTGLTAGTAYTVKVRAYCDSIVQSSWASAISVTTPHVIPFVETFDATSNPVGWTVSGWSFGDESGAFDSHAYAYMYRNSYNSSIKKWLISPTVLMENGVKLSFDVALTANVGTLAPPETSSSDKFVVQITTDGGSTWEILRQWDNAGSEYVYNNIPCSAEGENVSIELSSYVGQNIAIAFYVESTLYSTANTLHIDNVHIDYGLPCKRPTGLAATDVTLTSATVTWTGEGSTFNLQYKVSNAADWTEVNGVSDLSYNLTDLVSNTTYSVRVQQVCGEDTSDWRSATFITPMSIPLLETFNATSCPTGWTSSYWNFSNRNGVFDNHAYCYTAYAQLQAWLVSPTVRMENGVFLSFDMALTSTMGTLEPPQGGSRDKFEVLITADGGNTWEILRQWDNMGSEYVYNNIPCTADGENVSFDLSNYAGQNIAIAFYVETLVNAGSNHLHIDNVSIDYGIPCKRPTGLAATDVAVSSATLTWNENGTATTWQVCLNDDTTNLVTADTNPFSLTGLTAGTVYSVMVRANCGSNGNSDWTDPVSFTTCNIFSSEFEDAICESSLPYVWNEIPYNESGNYTQSLQTAAGCDSVVTLHLTVHPDPTVSITGSTNVNLGQSTTLTASGADIYSWSVNGANIGNNDSITVSPEEATTYSVAGYMERINLVVNGDFEQGKTGFNTGYSYVNDGSWGHYYIGHDNHEMWSWDPAANIITDHTSGNGLWMMVDAYPNRNIWTQTVEVKPNTNYVFSAWFATDNIANVRFEINSQQGEIFTTPQQWGVWERRQFVWNSGNAAFADLKITTGSASSSGHDFGIDDISFSELICENTASATVTVNYPPTVTTVSASNVTPTTATCGGNVISGGSAEVTGRGVCWSTSQNPTVADAHTTDGTGTGEFTSAITELMPNTTYYVRAYATNSIGTVYGEEVTFTTPCYTVTLTISGDNAICESEEVSLAANLEADGFVPENLHYTWYESGNIRENSSFGPGHDNEYAEYMFARTEPYRFSVEISYGSGYTCVSQSGEYLVYVYPEPIVSITASETNICVGGNTTLNAEATGSGTLSYSWSDGSSFPAVTISPNQAGTFPFSVIVTDVLTGCTATDEITIDVADVPVVTLTRAAGYAASVCEGSATAIEAVVTGGYGDVSYYIWYENDILLPDETNAVLNIENLPVGANDIYYVKAVQEASGCYNVVSAALNTLVTVYPQFTASILGASSVCEGNAISLTAMVDNASADDNLTYQWFQITDGVATAIEGANAATYTSTGSQNGSYDYQLEVYGSVSGCNAVSDPFQVNVLLNPTVTITGPTNVDLGQSVTLTADGAESYEWSANDANIGDDASVTVSPEAPTTYSVTGTDQYGCTGTSSVTVTVNYPPTVTTDAVSDIMAYSATCGGNVTADGGAEVTGRGVCWSTAHNPTTADAHTADGAGTGEFTSVLTELTRGTTYYVKAYATNRIGTAYGEEVAFTTSFCPSPVTFDTAVCANAMPLTWHGHTFEEGETYTATYQTAVGCDSVVTISLTVLPSLVGEPTTLTPIADDTVSNYPINFTWNAVENAPGYDLYVWPAGEPQPQQPTVTQIHGTQHTLSELPNNTDYQWFVKTFNTCDTVKSAIRQFSLNVTPALTVTSDNPVDFGEIPFNSTRSVYFQVNGTALDAPINYQLTGADASSFSLAPANTWDDLHGGRMQLTFHPTVPQSDYTAQMTIQSGNLVETVTVMGALSDFYTFTTYVDDEVYAMDSDIPIHGQVINLLNESVAGLNVEVVVKVMDYVRTLPATSDANGQFTVMFTPQHSEAGYYTVGSRKAGHSSQPEHDAFNIPGMMLTSSDWILWNPTLDNADTGTIAVRNRSQLPLTNIQVTPMSLPNGCTVQFLPLNLAGMATGELQYIVSGSVTSTGVNYEEVPLHAVSDEGASMDFSAWYYCIPQRADLNVLPTSLVTTMTRGKSKVVDFMIYNNGTGSTGNIYVSLPNVPWMSVVGSDTLPSLAAHDSAYVSIRLLADSTTDLVRYTGNFAIHCERGEGVSIPYDITAISDSTGTLVVDVTDEYAWNTNNGHGPHLAGASVTVKGYYSLETVATGVTNDNGLFVADDLPEGWYKLIIRANRHAEYQNNLYITAGDTNLQDIFIPFQAITYSWDVVPTEIEDVYTYELNVDFETHVPKPVVTMDIDRTLSLLEDCEMGEFNVLATNHGLVAAMDVSVVVPQSDYFVFTPLVSHIDSLPALTTYTIPVTYQRKDCTELGHLMSMSAVPTKAKAPDYYDGITCAKEMFNLTYWYFCRITHWETVISGDLKYDKIQEICGGDTSRPTVNVSRPTSGPGPDISNITDIAINPDWVRNYPYINLPNLTGYEPGVKKDTDWVLPDILKFCDPNLTPCQNALNGVSGCIPVIPSNMSIDSHNDIHIDEFANKVDQAKEDLTAMIAYYGADLILDLISVADQMGCMASILYNYPNIKTCIQSWTNPYTASEIRDRDIATIINICKHLAWSYVQSSDFQEGLDDIVNPSNNDVIITKTLGVLAQKSDPSPANNLQLSSLNQNNAIFNEGYITNAGRAQLLAECLEKDDRPGVEEFVNAFVDRWNHSMEAWDSGYFTAADAPEGYDTNFIQLDTNLLREFHELNQEALLQGYANVFERFDGSVNALQEAMDEYQENQHSSSLCATVTVQFSQKMTMTREAFEGTLTINNGNESNPIQDIDVDFVIRDENGVDCTNLFQINFLSYNNMTGTNGSLVLDAENEGSIIVQFIPTKQAAPEIAKVYSFGGTLSFIDPFTGEYMNNNLYPVDIWVHPSPDLYVNYFMQRDILGDDPLTEENVEPIVPAELGVIIHNRGAGIAKNVILETAEPRIIDNEKGLAINFAMYGAAFNGNERQLGLMAIPFGNIEPNRTGVGEWWFTSTLLGHFVSYEAHVIHNSSFGNPDLSLVSSLRIHPLIHTVYAYGNLDDGINDFLVDDVDDYRQYPDSLYFSNGSRTAVAIADSIGFDHYVTPLDTIVQLTLDPSRIGWNYEQTWDPGRGQYKLISCTRNSDQQVIPLSNVWQSFVTLPVGGDPVYEDRLHIVDTLNIDQPTTYTLVFSLHDLVLEVDTIMNVPDSIITAPLSEVTVKFNKPIVDSTFSNLDMSLKCNNGENLLDENLNVERIDSMTYKLHLEPYTHQSGYYVLDIQTLEITDANGFNGYYAKRATWTQNINTCQPDSVSISVTECDSYTWAGVTYHESGDIVRKFYNTAGCDSVVTLHLTINYSNEGDTIAVVCNQFDWYEHMGLTESGEYTHTFTNAAGCDSVVTLHLTVNHSNEGDTIAVVCNQFDWYEHTGLTESGEYTHTFTNAAGCDSVVTLHLTVTPCDPDAVVVTIVGHTGTSGYDGSEHSVSGFDVTAIEIGGEATTLYTEADFGLAEGVTATASRTDAGQTNMGLTAESFVNNNTDFETVVFLVTDGWQRIGKRSVTISLDSNKVYDGEVFTVNADQLHVTGLLEGQTLTGQLWTEEADPGVYENHNGFFQATLEAGVIYSSLAVQSATSSNVTSNYTPAFDVTLIIEEAPQPCAGVTYQGHDYEAVQIGSQCWLTEDLRVPVGDHHAYNDNPANVEKFGYLYSWYTAVGVDEGDIDTLPPTLTADDGTPYVQGICPAGWAVPSMADIAELDHFVGTTSLLKDPSTDYWLPGFEGATDGTGFNARGCGWYNAAQERYEDLRTGYHFWAADAQPGTITIYSACTAYYCDTIILTDPNQKNDRKSVRCIRKVAP